MASFLAKKLPPIRELLGGGLLDETGKMIIYGRQKLGKSLIANNLMWSLMGGQDWYGIKTPVSGTSTMYVQVEVSDRRLQDRMLKMQTYYKSFLTYKVKAASWVWTVQGLKLDTAEGVERLERHVKSHTPEVLILDPMYKLLANPNEPENILKFQSGLEYLQSVCNMAIVIIAHPRKQQTDPDPNQPDGDSSDLYGPMFNTAWPDTVIKLYHKRQSPDDNRVLVVADARNAEEVVKPIYLKLDRSDLVFKPTQAF